MSKYQYLGTVPRIYLNVVIPGVGSLVAEPGQIVEFEQAPTDGLWVKVPNAKPKAAKPETTEPEEVKPEAEESK